MNEEIIRELNKILPVVERVHGDNHPELHEVAKLYAAVTEAPSAELWQQLRRVTDNFTAPADACPTYEKTYHHLLVLAEAAGV